jgi:hypothetical protein
MVANSEVVSWRGLALFWREQGSMMDGVNAELMALSGGRLIMDIGPADGEKIGVAVGSKGFMPLSPLTSCQNKRYHTCQILLRILTTEAPIVRARPDSERQDILSRPLGSTIYTYRPSPFNPLLSPSPARPANNHGMTPSTIPSGRLKI